MTSGPSNSNLVPLAKAGPLAALPGRWRKHLNVPPGRLGVVLIGGETARTYLPGRHQALSPWERLRGRGLDAWAGYLPQEPFAIALKAIELQSGDGELLDASLVLNVAVADPGRALRELVVPVGELHAGDITLGDEGVKAALAHLARPYAAADLIRDLGASPALLAEARGRLEPLLANYGLEAHSASWLAFWRAAERAEIAERAQELRERLSEVDLQARMAEIENEVQLRDFIRQFDPELVARLGIRADGSAEGSPAGWAATLGAWLNAQVGKARPLLENLFKGEAPPEGKDVRPALRKNWWLPRTLAILALLAIGILITVAVLTLGRGLPGGAVGEFLIAGVWVVIAQGVLEMARGLINIRLEHKESQAIYDAKHYQQAGVTYLDDLVRSDPARADDLVRGQVSRELEHITAMLNELRARVYRAGETALALQLRELERKLERYRVDVSRPDFGAPPYVQALDINANALANLLDEDEDLLFEAERVSAAASGLQAVFSAGGISSGSISSLEASLDQLHHRFAGRSRAIKQTEQVPG